MRGEVSLTPCICLWHCDAACARVGWWLTIKLGESDARIHCFLRCCKHLVTCGSSCVHNWWVGSGIAGHGQSLNAEVILLKLLSAKDRGAFTFYLCSEFSNMARQRTTHNNGFFKGRSLIYTLEQLQKYNFQPSTTKSDNIGHPIVETGQIWPLRWFWRRFVFF